MSYNRLQGDNKRKKKQPKHSDKKHRKDLNDDDSWIEFKKYGNNISNRH